MSFKEQPRPMIWRLPALATVAAARIPQPGSQQPSMRQGDQWKHVNDKHASSDGTACMQTPHVSTGTDSCTDCLATRPALFGGSGTG
jgi:hypothetical protein